MSIEHVKVGKGEGWYTLAARLSPAGITFGQKERFAGLLAATNGYVGVAQKLYEGQVLHYHTEDVPVVEIPEVPPTVPPVPEGFIADTLTKANTGMRKAASATAGMTVFTSKDSGRIVSGVQFNGPIVLSGVEGITFVDCSVLASIPVSYFPVSGKGKNVRFEFCDLGPSNGATNADIDGVTLFRCKIVGFENAVRTHSNVVIDQCWIGEPKVNAGAHVDGIEIYGFDGEQCVNVTIRDSRIDIGTEGATAPVFGSPYTSIKGLTVERNVLVGGSNTVYFEAGCSDIMFVDNKLSGWKYRPVVVEVPRSAFLKWSGNTANGQPLPQP